jgi:hypothetical protein
MGVFGPENRVTGELECQMYVDTARLTPNTLSHPAGRFGGYSGFRLYFVDTFRDMLEAPRYPRIDLYQYTDRTQSLTSYSLE